MIRQVKDEPDYRFTLANERTFLAWQRTALGLLAATVALLKFVPGPAVQGMQYILSTVLGMLAIVSTGAGLLRWRQVDRAIRRTERLPHNRTPALLASGLAGDRPCRFSFGGRQGGKRMNDRVVASMHSSGVQLELMALAWRRTSLSVLANVVLPWSTKFLDQSGPSHSISSGLAFAVAVVAQCAGRGGKRI